MGQDNGIQTSETDNINNNLLLESYKGPEFILNKNYPNKENMSLEEIIKSHLEEMNYSFKNKENENININSQVEPNSLTPKFQTKKECRNIKTLDINSNSINEQEEKNQNIKFTNNINNTEPNFISGINNSNININININIDLPKITSTKSIIETLRNSSKEISIKSKKSKNKDSKTVKFSNLNPLSNINKEIKKNLLEQITQIKMKPSSLMKDIRKEFKFVKPLGGGHFGTVRKAYRRSDIISTSFTKSS